MRNSRFHLEPKEGGALPKRIEVLDTQTNKLIAIIYCDATIQFTSGDFNYNISDIEAIAAVAKSYWIIWDSLMKKQSEELPTIDFQPGSLLNEPDPPAPDPISKSIFFIDDIFPNERPVRSVEFYPNNDIVINNPPLDPIRINIFYKGCTRHFITRMLNLPKDRMPDEKMAKRINDIFEKIEEIRPGFGDLAIVPVTPASIPDTLSTIHPAIKATVRLDDKIGAKIINDKLIIGSMDESFNIIDNDTAERYNLNAHKTASEVVSTINRSSCFDPLLISVLLKSNLIQEYFIPNL